MLSLLVLTVGTDSMRVLQWSSLLQDVWCPLMVIQDPQNLLAPCVPEFVTLEKEVLWSLQHDPRMD